MLFRQRIESGLSRGGSVSGSVAAQAGLIEHQNRLRRIRHLAGGMKLWGEWQFSQRNAGSTMVACTLALTPNAILSKSMPGNVCPL